MDAMPAPAPALRQTRFLDGTWEFRHESDPAWRAAQVPSPWQSFPDLAWSFGRATYRRRFSVPPEWQGREIALHFGAVSDIATVRLNGQRYNLPVAESSFTYAEPSKKRG